MPKIIGIDLGTTNSVGAVMQGAEPIVIPSSEGERLVPSVVAINKNHERLVGRVARNQAIVNSQNTIFSIKRFMGRKYEDAEVQRTLPRIPYTALPADNGDVRVRMDDKEYSPPEISAMILAKIKRDAEAYLGEPVTQAVITVPAYFNDAQRNATKDAGRIAGLDVLRIINEPTASSLAYGLDKKANEIIAVYDLGGGTFDISILDVGEGVFQVRATNGNTFLGGDDFDQRIMDYFTQEFKKESGIDLRSDRQALQRLREAAEKAKIELSTTMQTEINLPYLTADSSGPKHLVMTLTRAKLEQLTADLVEGTLTPLKQALNDAGLKPADINEVVMVGGMTRMPAVQEAVRKFFNKEPHKGVNPDEVVAVGAAIQAGVLGGEVKDILLLDVTPLTLSIETLGSVATPQIERNTTIPTRKSQVFSTASDNQTQVEIHILQGERPMAQDKASGRSQNITITASSGLAKEEVERMRKEAEAHAAEDKKRHDLIEARNVADNSIYAAQKVLSDLGEKVPAEIKTMVTSAIDDLKKVKDGDDEPAIRKAVDALSQVVQKLSAAAYEAQTPPPAGGAAESGPRQDGPDVVDGEATESK